MPYDQGAQRSQGARKADDPKYETLAKVLRQEERWSVTYQESEVKTSQIEALKRYYGDEYGDEVDGRSRVTTREVFETVEWLRPDLRRTFTSGDRVCEFEGVTPESDQYADEASDFINHVFLNDNEGERELDSFIFDGLLQRIGVIAADWKEAEYSPAQEVSGLNSMQAQQLVDAPDVQIVEQDVQQGQADEAHPDGLFFAFKIKNRTKIAKPEVFAIAPEDFRIAARTVDLQNSRYAGDIVRMMLGEAKQKWPDYEEDLDNWQSESGADERRAERFRDVENWDAQSMMGSDAEGEGREVEIMREYIRYDLDEDGYPEMHRVFRIGDTILECDEVDEHIYAHWTPTPIPHRLIGLGVHDQAADLQRTKTVLLRSALDSVYQNVAPRIAADSQKVSLEDLLTVRPGAVVRVEGAPADSLMPIVVPDLSVNAFQAGQIIDRMLESRTGVTRQAQGMDPDLLHDTAKGVELLQNAQSVRKEEIARNLAVGLQVFFMKLYRLVHKHQNEARAIKIAGQWKNIDPRAWSADVRCTVSVGLGTGAKEKQLIQLGVIKQDMMLAYQTFGPGNPSVTPQGFYEIAKEEGRILGYKSIDKFIKPPMVQGPDGQMQPWMPQPQPSPDQMKVQAQIQEGQAKLQMEGQKAVQDAQIKQFEVQAQTKASADKAAMDAQISQMELQGRLTILREESEQKMQLAWFEANQKATLAREQFEFEKQMQERETAAKIETMKKQADAKVTSGGGTKFGGDPG